MLELSGTIRRIWASQLRALFASATNAERYQQSTWNFAY
jgi:hypothetical protein